MPTVITAELLKPYFKDGKKGNTYDECVQLEKGLRIHADGIMPEELIKKQRPSEPLEVMTYRTMIWQAITKETVSRIVTCLSKIRRSSDWSVKFDEKKFPASITKAENPIQYFDYNYPYFGSLTNWLFSVCLKNYLIDANAVCAVIPLEFPVPGTVTAEYLKPYPYIFNSEQVLEYVEADYCIIKSLDKSTYYSSDGKTKYTDGDIFWVISTTHIYRYEQINANKDLAVKVNFEHLLGYMPAFKLGGIYLKSKDKVPIWESRINSIVPRLNKAAREDNDLDISVVRHLFPEKWEYVSVDCTTCNGVGKVMGVVGGVSGMTTCGKCNGFGRTVSSPMQSHLILPSKLDEQQIPSPPAGYIEKPVEIIAHQELRIEAHIFKALAAINMEFLSKTPLAESGIAKEVDRDELNNFVYSIAEDLVRIMDKILIYSYDYRYSVVVPMRDDRMAMLPVVNVPEKYDMLSVNYLIEEYQKAKESKMNPVLINKMEQEIATKKFSTDPDMAAEINCILKLNPFAGMSSDDLMINIQNKFITQEDAVISANIVQFVRRAKFEDDKFYTLELDDQQAVMKKYAQEKIKENSKADELKAKMFALPGGEPGADPAQKDKVA